MSEKEQHKIYEQDPRLPCRYGVKCYQKNSIHHEKYKHPPKKTAKKIKTAKHTAFGKKRKNNDNDNNASTDSPERKVQKTESEVNDAECSSSSFTDNNAVEKSIRHKQELKETTVKHESFNDAGDLQNKISMRTLLKDSNIDVESTELSNADAQIVISHLFLIEMPEDFFQFYDLCKTISKEDPFNAFKGVKLQLVGPYDVFNTKFMNSEVNEREDLLRHWRYYYDPPEFQTILKVDDKDGLHFGYWRDSALEKPIFVAKNRSNVNCVIEPAAKNILGAVNVHVEEALKLANPFEKTHITRLQQKLRNYAKDKNITLEIKTADMQERQRKVVAKTFHTAGIVVPYDKKTQLGYRDLAMTDKDLLKHLKQIESAQSSEERKVPMSKLEEVVRLATIAADECDFGTCLELGHDLFSSGISHVQGKAVQMLSIAYNLLGRSQFFEILKVHLKDRRQGLNLSVL